MWVMILLLFFYSQSHENLMLLADVKSVPSWKTAASIPPQTAGTGAWETPVYFPIDARCCQAGMALGDPADSLLLQLLWAASPHPCSPLSASPPHPPPGKRNGFFHANLSLSQQRWRQPKCESRGGRRKAPSLPAIAVRRLLLLWSHSGKTFPFIVGNIFHEDPARTTAVVKVNGFLGLSVSTLWTGHISA